MLRTRLALLNKDNPTHAHAALYRIVLTRMRHDPQTRAYLGDERLKD